MRSVLQVLILLSFLSCVSYSKISHIGNKCKMGKSIHLEDGGSYGICFTDERGNEIFLLLNNSKADEKENGNLYWGITNFRKKFEIDYSSKLAKEILKLMVEDSESEEVYSKKELAPFIQKMNIESEMKHSF